MEFLPIPSKANMWKLMQEDIKEVQSTFERFLKNVHRIIKYFTCLQWFQSEWTIFGWFAKISINCHGIFLSGILMCSGFRSLDWIDFLSFTQQSIIMSESETFNGPTIETNSCCLNANAISQVKTALLYLKSSQLVSGLRQMHWSSDAWHWQKWQVSPLCQTF